MADLLECLIQISALSEAVTRSLPAVASDDAVPTEGVTVSQPWERMADAERRYAAALAVDARTAADSDDSRREDAPARDEFVRLRRANLEALGRCSAAELGRAVAWPGRRSTTVADLVAIMLAHDTEVLGRLRLVCGEPVHRSWCPESGMR